MINLIFIVFILATSSTFALIKLSNKLNIIDIPNDRSLHTKPVPRTGGIAIIVTFLLAITRLIYLPSLSSQNFITLSPELYYLILATGVIALISFIDDCINLSNKFKLIIHLAIITYLLKKGLVLNLSSILNISNLPYLIYLTYFAYFCSAFFILWLSNLYNFMDGLDGFASGMTVIGFGALSLISWHNDNQNLAIINLIISIAACGVLVFNFPPAKIFLGDNGSASIGFFAAGMAILAHNQHAVSIWQSIIIFSPFITDASITLIKRLLRKENIFKAHRTHYYQQLALKIGHKKTVLLSYGLMLTCASIAFLNINLIVAATIILTLYFILISLLESKLQIA
ncbi:MAG: glycosyltransferase family 4 protein [Gammaproteobacteria bacterium]|nr:glycosyltransferase family 4 protein [Gammaproteobacteria bacterium]